MDAYAALASMPVGLAWCAMFVFFCYERAAAQLRLKNPIHRHEGVYVLNNEKVTKCTFIRIV